MRPNLAETRDPLVPELLPDTADRMELNYRTATNPSAVPPLWYLMPTSLGASALCFSARLLLQLQHPRFMAALIGAVVLFMLAAAWLARRRGQQTTSVFLLVGAPVLVTTALTPASPIFAWNRERGEMLGTVIQQNEAVEARQQSRAVAVARAEATTEVRQQVAAAEGEKVREIGRSETAKVKAEEDAEQARIDAEARRVRQQGERDRLLKLAKDPAVQACFAPFLAAGRRYPARYEGSVRWLERKPWGRTPPRPVSLKELSTGGVLDSLQNFVVAAASSKSKTGAQNDRPHWPMPGTAGDWEPLKADFELFQQLAPVWAELSVIPAD